MPHREWAGSSGGRAGGTFAGILFRRSSQRGGKFVERGRSRNKFADGEVLRQPDSRKAIAGRCVEASATGDGERGEYVGALLLGRLHSAGRRRQAPSVRTIEVTNWNPRMRRENNGRFLYDL